ncbi:MAG: hypothetical protein JKY23_02430, partial [Nitrospinaceae bacterium]|nr:hypothetical protein [Nitrospinaceae bacterium]
MISFKSAREIVFDSATISAEESISIFDGLDRVCAEDIFAAFDVPFHDITSVDGYAMKFEDYESGKSFEIVGEVPAGAIADQSLKKGEVYRIFTGAAVPDSADTCIMQEYAEIGNGSVSFSDHTLKLGSNVRKSGGHVHSGDLVVQKGTQLNAPGLAMLKSLGVQEIKVAQKPIIEVIVTGNEFATSFKD